MNFNGTLGNKLILLSEHMSTKGARSSGAHSEHALTENFKIWSLWNAISGSSTTILLHFLSSFVISWYLCSAAWRTFLLFLSDFTCSEIPDLNTNADLSVVTASHSLIDFNVQKQVRPINDQKVTGGLTELPRHWWLEPVSHASEWLHTSETLIIFHTFALIHMPSDWITCHTFSVT